MTKKRIAAYIIDMLIVTIISSFIYTLPLFAKDQEYYLNNYESYTKTYTEYLKNNKNEEDLVNSEYKMIKSSSTILIIKVGVTLIYFSILPYFKNGQTIGKKIFKLRIGQANQKELKPGNFFIRGLISSVVLIDIINLFILLLSNKNIYLITSIITSYLTYMFYITSFICILINKNKRSFHDLITNTKVIETK